MEDRQHSGLITPINPPPSLPRAMTAPATTSKGTPLYSLPIAGRPAIPLRRWPVAIAFTILHPLGHLTIHAAQLLLIFCVALPLRIVCAPFGLSYGRRFHDEVVRWTKGCYALLMLLVTQLFAPTEVTLSLEGENLQPEKVLVRDSDGRLVGFNFPKKLVVMGNHQVYSDWMYLWAIMYFSGHHMDVYIALKKSLKWVPIVGWAMQIFNFIFLERSWAHDRVHFSQKLAEIGKRAEHTDQPLALFLFPEGTLVSKATRPPSKKYAMKLGIPDNKYTLLPRSTGMQFALRSLLPRVPDLHLLDATIIYPGIPPTGFGQSYYTLRSIWLAGVPPPRVHIHLKLYNVRQEVPIGSISTSGVGSEVEVSEEDRVVFEKWMQARFREKDEDFERFYKDNTIANQQSHLIPPPRVESLDKQQPDGFTYSKYEIALPLRPRSPWEALDAFALPGPLAWGLINGTLR